MLVIGAPTVRDTLRCLETVLFSKKARLAQLGIETAYDFYGTPSSLVVDNGGENIGQRLPLLAHIGIDAWRCKANQGQEKPFIERLNLSLKEALEVLPGCTRFDGVDGKRDTERLGDANMTLEQLEYWIVSWYYKFWANQKLERHVHAVFTDLVHFGNTPATRWKRMVEEHGFALPLPPNPAAWRTLFFERAERTLCRKTGITYEGFHFRGANLPYLIDKYGEERVPILVDPDDFRRIYVQDGSDEDLIELINASVNEVTPAYSFQAGKAKLIETWGSDEGNREEAENFNREKFAHASASNGKHTKKLSKPKQSRETTQAAKHGQAVHRAAENPLPPVLPVADSGVPFISFDEAPVLPVLNRTTGQQQQQP
jgi:putative transposase